MSRSSESPTHSDDDDQEQGQVSEVQSMPADDGDAEISDSQGVAGNPEAPSADELGAVGPNANPHADEHTH